jgi:hypothetical protein
MFTATPPKDRRFRIPLSAVQSNRSRAKLLVAVFLQEVGTSSHNPAQHWDDTLQALKVIQGRLRRGVFAAARPIASRGLKLPFAHCPKMASRNPQNM